MRLALAAEKVARFINSELMIFQTNDANLALTASLFNGKISENPVSFLLPSYSHPIVILYPGFSQVRSRFLTDFMTQAISGTITFR